MPPPSSDPQFLAAMGKGVYEAMRAGDPKATLGHAGLDFRQRRRTSGSRRKARRSSGPCPTIAWSCLDLACENSPVWTKTEAFYGKPWVWAVVQDYGGNVGLHAGLPQIAANLREAMTSPQRGPAGGHRLGQRGTGLQCRG